MEFCFSDIMFKQIDGIAMGSPLGPTLANIFVRFHESRLLSDESTRPVICFRYVDDCFAIFKKKKKKKKKTAKCSVFSSATQ